ncbi:Zn-dependent hydrolase [Roseibium aggregatum]|uniref:Zn-dependent hydrolase n=1 Tax=Roseibium aggregatum TaxID=187304 RepID=A0A939J3X3_9HYPH|nr:Zn-dependent hydrolase [Roseibium aggregatum]MBN9672958.1 Zn-dependent hydrolase [Roseibium aggregatum]
MRRPAVKIDLQRLKTLLDGVNSFGFDDDTGGYNRPGFSKADIDCREWFAAQMEADGLSVSTDCVMNLFARYGPAEGPCIMVGSHTDTVVNGGAFDGSLGACVALECVRCMKEAGIVPQTAVEVVVTSEEEGRFGGMLGSQTITGQVTPDWVAQASDAEGTLLSDAMRRRGLDPLEIPQAARPPGSVKAFLELHIEQGPVLERSGTPIGIADRVSGVCYLEVEFQGIANHSGTTPMDLRSDAFAGLAELAVAIPDIIRDKGTGQSRITIGHVTLTPNHPHTVPGQAVFSIILRDTSEEIMRLLRADLEARATGVAARHGLGIKITEKSWLAPVMLDPDIAARLEVLAQAHGLKAVRMPSGAGHDAQTMQAFCPAGLIFVPSRNGISHAPEEHSDWEDIEQGANLFLQALIEMSA